MFVCYLGLGVGHSVELRSPTSEDICAGLADGEDSSYVGILDTTLNIRSSDLCTNSTVNLTHYLQSNWNAASAGTALEPNEEGSTSVDEDSSEDGEESDVEAIENRYDEY
jgi:hypothetical protein